MKRENDPLREGHTREWADRGRVELDPRKDVAQDASPRQSPFPDDRNSNRRDDTRDSDYDAEDKVY